MTKEEFLQQHQIFENLSESHIAALAQITDEVQYENGAMVAYQGDVADCLYIVKNGRLYAETRENDIQNNSYVVETENYISGNYFGDGWLFEPNVHPANVKAQSHGNNPATLLIIKATNFVRFLIQYPEVLPQLATETAIVNDEEVVVGGMSYHAYDEAQKLFSKAKKRRTVVSILPDELVEYSARRSRLYLLVQIFFPVLALLTIPALSYLFFLSQPPASFIYRLRFAVPGFLLVIMLIIVLFQVLDWSNDYFCYYQ